MADFVDPEQLLPPETATEFWKTFSALLQVVRTALDSLPSDKIIEYVKQQKVWALSAQKYADQSSNLLAPFDVKRSKDLVDTLLKDIRALEEKYQPKKKFAFSSRSAAKSAAVAASAPSSSSIANYANSIATEPRKAAAVIPLPPGSYVLQDLTDSNLTLDESPTAKDGIACQLLMWNNKNCRFTLAWQFGSIRLEHLSNCTLYLGPCATSVYLEGVNNCVVYAACHQLRIHNCRDCSLYIRCQSHPIIEDCSNMGFAPYLLVYPAVEKDLLACDLQQAACWRNVVDFRWHKPEHSPNWYEISSADRIEHCLGVAPSPAAVTAAGHVDVATPMEEISRLALSAKRDETSHATEAVEDEDEL